MVIIGIDPDSARLAVAVLRQARRPIIRTLPRADYRGRIDAGYDAALESLMGWASEKGAAVFAEDCWLGRNSATFKSLSQVQGELLAAARRHDVEIELVAPSAWQRAVLGFSKDRDALKAASIEYAQEMTSQDGALSEHEADAVCIAAYGLRQCQTEERATA